MEDEECRSEALARKDEILNGNSAVECDILRFPVAKQEEINEEGAALVSPKRSEELTKSDAEELFKHIPGLKEVFRIKCKIGEGTFSNVYLVQLIEDSDELFAIKHIIPTSSPERVEREVRCLQQMGGVNNVIGYKGTVRNHDHSAVILPYFPHDKFQDYLKNMTVSDIQDYMRNLFQALQHVHCFSVIHRDIKPGNFLHSRSSRRYNLVDFGLAMHEPGSDKAWNIEKKGSSVKNVARKSVRLLSPESAKAAQASKKPRTSPRFSLSSQKFTRQTVATTKSSLKSSLKQGHAISNKQFDMDMKQHGKPFTKLPSHEEKPFSQSLKSSSGLCETHHKKTDVCSLCMKRSSQVAPRAGTSGFRAPEVLLKHPNQTTAVDIWSAGVIMLCLLSGRYPFFRCFDDMTALAQIISLFGKQRVTDSTKQLGKYMVSKKDSTGFDLKKLCQRLRLCAGKESECSTNECCKNCTKIKKTEKARNKQKETSRNAQSKTTVVSGSVSNCFTSPEKTKVRLPSTGLSVPSDGSARVSFRPSGKDSVREHLDGTRCHCYCGSCSRYVPNSAYDLLERCLDLNPKSRITASQALSHQFLINGLKSGPSSQSER